MRTPVNSIVLFICFFILCHNGIEADNRKDHLEIDRLLKLLNRPGRKTIVTNTFVLYDCVDFDKQPAFNISSKIRKTELQVNSSFLKTITSQNKKTGKLVNIGFEREGCPLGTVPLKRVTKSDLIRERIASKMRSMGNEGNKPYAAVVRTDFRESHYTGAEALISVHNPKVSDGQFSAARLKISNGPDSIEAGWRVDPTLYGGNKTRLYIRTDVGQTHCFNTLCPGFVIESKKVVLGRVLGQISRPGESAYVIRVSVVRDVANGNWNLHIGKNNLFVGYWPSSLFNNIPTFANYLEWGGEVYGPPGSVAPQMGAGHSLDKNTHYDAYFREVTGFDHKGDPLDPYADDLVESTNRKEYEIFDKGFGDEVKRLVYYGGPGGFVL